MSAGDCDVDIWENVADVNGTYGNTLLWAHSPSAMAVQTTDWDCHDEQWEPSEIYSAWGNALTSDASYDPIDDKSTRRQMTSIREEATVCEALAGDSSSASSVERTNTRPVPAGVSRRRR